MADSQSNRDDETFDGLDAGSGWQKGPTGWIAQLTLGATDAVFPRGSWPWTTGRCAAVALAGRGEGAAKEFADLRDSDHCGPVACLAAGTIARWTGVNTSATLAIKGLKRLGADDFRKNYAFLFESKDPLARQIRAVIAVLGELDDAELAAILKGLPPRDLKCVTAGIRELRKQKGRDPAEALRAALDAMWQAGLRRARAGRLGTTGKGRGGYLLCALRRSDFK